MKLFYLLVSFFCFCSCQESREEAMLRLVSGINVFNAQKSEVLSDTVLANVEALADEDDGNWYCVGDVDVCFEDDKGILKGKHYTIDQEGPKD